MRQHMQRTLLRSLVRALGRPTARVHTGVPAADALAPCFAPVFGAACVACRRCSRPVGLRRMESLLGLVPDRQLARRECRNALDRTGAARRSVFRLSLASRPWSIPDSSRMRATRPRNSIKSQVRGDYRRTGVPQDSDQFRQPSTTGHQKFTKFHSRLRRVRSFTHQTGLPQSTKSGSTGTPVDLTGPVRQTWGGLDGESCAAQQDAERGTGCRAQRAVPIRCDDERPSRHHTHGFVTAGATGRGASVDSGASHPASFPPNRLRCRPGRIRRDRPRLDQLHLRRRRRPQR